MALIVDTSGEYIRRTANLPVDTAFTIAGWFKRVTDNSYEVPLGLFQADGGNNWCVQCLITPSGDTNCMTLRDGQGNNAAWTGKPAVGDWVYLAITGDASNRKGYWYNSSFSLVESVKSFANGGSYTVTNFAVMNSGLDSTIRNVLGNCAYVRLWDAALSQSEIEAEMRSRVPVRTSNLNTAFARNYATDVSGNGRNWTTSGVTTDGDEPTGLSGSVGWISTIQVASNTKNSGTFTGLTIPSNAKLAVLTLDGYAPFTHPFSNLGAQGAVPTLGGSAMTNADTGGLADGSASHQGGMYYLVNPSTGSGKSLTFNWQDTTDPLFGSGDPCLYQLSFFDNVVTGIRSRGGQQTSTLGGTTGALGSHAGDLILALAAYWGPPPSLTWSSNVTERDVYTDQGSSVRIASGIATGDETVTTTVGAGYDGAIFAIAFTIQTRLNIPSQVIWM